MQQLLLDIMTQIQERAVTIIQHTMKQDQVLSVLIYGFCAAVKDNANTLGVSSPIEFNVYSKIQDAINAASDGELLEVRSGTYTEDLIINTANLQLRSLNGQSNTFLQLVDGVGITLQSGATNFTLGGAEGKGFTITSGEGTTRNIELENAPSGVGISYNIINTNGVATIGISVGAAGATNLVISNNNFIAEDGDGSIWGPLLVNANVSNNIFTGPNNPTSGYAVQSSGITGTSVISDNTISNYSQCISVFHGEGVSGLTISSNDISKCSSGLRFGQYKATGGADGDMTTITIIDNVLSNNSIGIRLNPSGANVKASQFTIVNNSCKKSHLSCSWLSIINS